MDKRGTIFDLFPALGLLLAAVLIVVAAFIIIGEVAKIDVLSDDESGEILQHAVQASHRFDFIPVLFFFGFVIGATVLSFFLRTSPLFLPFNLFIYFVGIVLAVGVSNAYETFLGVAPSLVTGATDTFVVSNFLLANLPVVYGVFGLVLLLFLFFVKPQEEVRDTGI